ncbi:hypothetical protein OBB00_05645 [Gammaproteobacteria bacterium]|nr:hypothetical protein [Gammaproteobacteria bacterium]
MKVYGDIQSGNCYKIKLLAGLLDIQHEWIHVSVLEGGHKALRVMEQQFQQTPYLTENQLSTEDIALYAYIHVAGEGGFDLTGYCAVEAWLERIRSEPKYVAMQ